jgi:hypothetical protein
LALETRVFTGIIFIDHILFLRYPCTGQRHLQAHPFVNADRLHFASCRQLDLDFVGHIGKFTSQVHWMSLLYFQLSLVSR